MLHLLFCRKATAVIQYVNYLPLGPYILLY